MLCVNKSAQLCLAENGPGDPPPGKPPFHTFNRDVTRDIKAGDQPLFTLFHALPLSFLLTLLNDSSTEQQLCPPCSRSCRPALKVWPAKQSPFLTAAFQGPAEDQDLRNSQGHL